MCKEPVQYHKSNKEPEKEKTIDNPEKDNQYRDQEGRRTLSFSTIHRHTRNMIRLRQSQKTAKDEGRQVTGTFLHKKSYSQRIYVFITNVSLITN